MTYYLLERRNDQGDDIVRVMQLDGQPPAASRIVADLQVMKVPRQMISDLFTEGQSAVVVEGEIARDGECLVREIWRVDGSYRHKQ